MHYDKIIIGSSPICLLEAIYDDSLGIKTCIVDNAVEIGGAWKKLNTANGAIKNVEIGCHIIEKDKKVFDFLKKKLNLELLEMNPSPKIILKNKYIPYNLKNLLVFFRNANKYLTNKHGIKQLLYDVKVFLKELVQFNLKYYTFLKDSTTFIDRLTKEINYRNIAVLLSANITSAKVTTAEKIIELTTHNGEKLTTNKLAITYNSNFNDIFIDGKDRTSLFQHKKYEFAHLHLFISDEHMKKISYWRIFNDEIIHRISDMSHQVSRKKGEHLICVGVFSSFLQNKTNAEIIDSVFSRLKKMKLISDSCQIIKAEVNSYKGFYTNLYDLKHIQAETNDLVEVLNTLDISMGIKENLFKYNTVHYSTN